MSNQEDKLLLSQIFEMVQAKKEELPKKKKRVISEEQKARALENLKRGRETSLAKRKAKAEAKKLESTPIAKSPLQTVVSAEVAKVVEPVAKVVEPVAKVVEPVAKVVEPIAKVVETPKPTPIQIPKSEPIDIPKPKVMSLRKMSLW
jgi:hypothetical protein